MLLGLNKNMDDFEKILNKQLIDADIMNFKIKSVYKAIDEKDINGNAFYEKKRLLKILESRLKGCLLYDKQNKLIDFLKDSIETLKSIPDDSTIYYWEIIVNDKIITGRSTYDKLLHIFPYNFTN